MTFQLTETINVQVMNMMSIQMDINELIICRNGVCGSMIEPSVK